MAQKCLLFALRIYKNTTITIIKFILWLLMHMTSCDPYSPQDGFRFEESAKFQILLDLAPPHYPGGCSLTGGSSLMPKSSWKKMKAST